MKLPLAYTIPKPSIAESGSHIVISLPLLVDGGLLQFAFESPKPSLGAHTVGII